jgi:hypothetical protein
MRLNVGRAEVVVGIVKMRTDYRVREEKAMVHGASKTATNWFAPSVAIRAANEVPKQPTCQACVRLVDSNAGMQFLSLLPRQVKWAFRTVLPENVK